jgi:hypothetical protein
MDVEENLNAGLSRSGFLTYFTREAVRSALNVSFFLFFYFLLFYFFFIFHFSILSHPDIVIVPATSPFVILFARYGTFSKEVEDGCAEPDTRRNGSNPQTYGRFLETSTR